MPRRLRKDYPGAWHHVMNRGVARRTLFESRRDIRYFLSCLARRVRSGDLELHAYAILTTHFHLLVRSPRGELSRAMQRALDAYARWFNRGRRRDGPLFRGRFTNRLVETESYWANVVAYIDRNPVEAGLATRPSLYPHGSACHYSRRKGPPWLRRDLVERWTMGFAEGAAFDPGIYELEGKRAQASAWVVERRLSNGGSGGEDPLDDLLGAAGWKVREWMERKARLADGDAPGWILVSPAAAAGCIENRRRRRPEWEVGIDGRIRAGWDVLQAGVLRWYCGLKVSEIGRRLGLPRTTCQDRLVTYRLAFERSREFREAAAGLLAEALESEYASSSGSRPGDFWSRRHPPTRRGCREAGGIRDAHRT